MIFRFNRFAIFPVMCNCCKRYIWLAPYRRADVYHHIPGEYLKERMAIIVWLKSGSSLIYISKGE